MEIGTPFGTIDFGGIECGNGISFTSPQETSEIWTSTYADKDNHNSSSVGGVRSEPMQKWKFEFDIFEGYGQILVGEDIHITYLADSYGLDRTYRYTRLGKDGSVNYEREIPASLYQIRVLDSEGYLYSQAKNEVGDVTKWKDGSEVWSRTFEEFNNESDVEMLGQDEYRVYVSKAGYNEDAVIYCLRKEDGVTLWSVNQGSGTAFSITSAVPVGDNVFFIESPNNDTADSEVVKVDKETGDKIDSKLVSGRGVSIHHRDGVIYANSWYNIYALSPEDLSTIFRVDHTRGEKIRVTSKGIIAEYGGYGDTDNIKLLDLDNGTEIWKVSDTGDSRMATNSEVYHGGLGILDLTDGSILWRDYLPTEIVRPIENGLLIGIGGRLYRVSEEGDTPLPDFAVPR